jgi:hypothetical protein
MKYFDLVPWDNWLRSVSDIESIARIFSQGLFYDYKRLDEIVVLAFMFYMNGH